MADRAQTDRDRQLIAGVQRGDHAALGLLYDHHGPTMLGLAARILGNARDAEDLLQDVFVEIWHKAGHYDPARASVRTWMLLRLRSRALDRNRALAAAQRNGFTAVPVDIEAVPEPHAADDPSRDPDRARIRQALRALPAAQRQVLELGYFQGLTCREIAMHCEIPIGTVKSRLSAALARLRHALAADQVQE